MSSFHASRVPLSSRAAAAVLSALIVGGSAPSEAYAQFAQSATGARSVGRVETPLGGASLGLAAPSFTEMTTLGPSLSLSTLDSNMLSQPTFASEMTTLGSARLSAPQALTGGGALARDARRSPAVAATADAHLPFGTPMFPGASRGRDSAGYSIWFPEGKAPGEASKKEGVLAATGRFLGRISGFVGRKTVDESTAASLSSTWERGGAAQAAAPLASVTHYSAPAAASSGLGRSDARVRQAESPAASIPAPRGTARSAARYSSQLTAWTAVLLVAMTLGALAAGDPAIVPSEGIMDALLKVGGFFVHMFALAMVPERLVEASKQLFGMNSATPQVESFAKTDWQSIKSMTEKEAALDHEAARKAVEQQVSGFSLRSWTQRHLKDLKLPDFHGSPNADTRSGVRAMMAKAGAQESVASADSAPEPINMDQLRKEYGERYGLWDYVLGINAAERSRGTWVRISAIVLSLAYIPLYLWAGVPAILLNPLVWFGVTGIMGGIGGVIFSSLFAAGVGTAGLNKIMDSLSSVKSSLMSAVRKDER
ncbi:MAG: hypothetical protein HY078_08855 [Elusimicrobia bacterium]|nr:hypothetical protein [Elusimicrobiota bacterium]